MELPSEITHLLNNTNQYFFLYEKVAKRKSFFLKEVLLQFARSHVGDKANMWDNLLWPYGSKTETWTYIQNNAMIFYKKIKHISLTAKHGGGIMLQYRDLEGFSKQMQGISFSFMSKRTTEPCVLYLTLYNNWHRFTIVNSLKNAIMGKCNNSQTLANLTWLDIYFID